MKSIFILKKKLTYIISNIDKALAFEWVFEQLRDQYDITFIFLGLNYPSTGELISKQGGSVYFIKLKGKKNYPLVYVKLALLLKKIKPNIVHTHLRDADIIGLSLAKILGIKKRVTTRHSATFNKVYHPGSVKVDQQINRWATDIVAISENVRRVLLKEGVPDKKIATIHHGFDLDKFKNIRPEKVEMLQAKYKTYGNYPVIGVISRYFELKGHKYIIEAFQKLLNTYPHAKLVLANARGPKKESIQHMLKELSGNSYVEIDFEPDIFTLYQLFDVFIHTPIDPEIEAFGQTYVEALAAGIPSVFTLSGVAPEFIEDRKNAIVVGFKNSDEILRGIQFLLEDQELREKIIINGKASLSQFRIDVFINELMQLYNDTEISDKLKS